MSFSKGNGLGLQKRSPRKLPNPSLCGWRWRGSMNNFGSRSIGSDLARRRTAGTGGRRPGSEGLQVRQAEGERTGNQDSPRRRELGGEPREDARPPVGEGN